MENDALSARLIAGCEQFSVPGAQVGVMVAGHRAVACAGVLRTGEPSQVTPTTRFHAGSIAKSLTALVVLSAAREGWIDLDVPCSEQVPWLWDDAPRALLAQTTGRANVLPEVGEDLGDFVRRVGGWPRVHEPGRFSYCNAGWSVLDALLRERVGGSFEALAQRYLGAPLWFGPTAGAAEGHQVSPGTAPVVVAPTSADAASAAGSRWWTSVGELLDYAALHLSDGDGHFHPEDVRSLRTPQAPIPGATVADAWGLGWALWQRGEHRAFGWDGYTAGHRAFLRCYPDQDAAIVLLTNSAGPLFGPPGGSALFDALRGDLLAMAGVPDLGPPTRPAAGRPAPAWAGGYGPVTVAAESEDALVVDAAAFGAPMPLQFGRRGGDTFGVVGDPPGAIDIAFAGDLLYVGPFALPRQ